MTIKVTRLQSIVSVAQRITVIYFVLNKVKQVEVLVSYKYGRHQTYLLERFRKKTKEAQGGGQFYLSGALVSLCRDSFF